MKEGYFLRSRTATRLLAIVVIICTWLPGSAALGQTIVIPPPALDPLNQTPVPEPLNLFTYVTNKQVGIQLGKAFFWDMQAGSDDIVACATCHYHYGADDRKKNTLNPGTRARPSDTTFQVVGPNETLLPSHFPFHQRQEPAESQSDPVIRDSNDVVGSQGVRKSRFVDVLPDSGVEITEPVADPVFNDPVNSTAPFNNVRQVTARNAPTVINSIFNFNNLWDGRASYIFNGENPFGPADPNAGVWFNDPAQGLVKRPVALEFASVASQAVGPPVDDMEMSASGRTFPMIGRKLLNRTPLGKQLVSHDDSVLGGLAKSAVIPGAKGLHTGYDQLIKETFHANLWNSAQTTPDGFTQMEANFSFFWGVAIQLYLATLVSDQTPFDHWLGGDDTALTDEQKFGFAIFSGIGNCVACHAGAEFTSASHSSALFQNRFLHGLIELMFVSDGTQVIYDTGYNNTAVTPTTDDIGRAGTAPFTNPITSQPFPISFSGLAELQTQNRLPYPTPILPVFVPSDFPLSTAGSFKVPGLRNVELTAPYFHNGSVMTLEDVVDFYIRGGNFPVENVHDFDPVVGQGVSLTKGKENMQNALVAFLKSLTDARIPPGEAPFDHPELLIPEGDPEVLVRIPATDSNGVPVPQGVSINPVTTPTRVTAQTITGTVEAGATTPAVTVNTSATVGPVNVVGTDWSVEISGLAEGANIVSVSVVDSLGVLTTRAETITLDTVPPVLTLNPVSTPTSQTSQTISGTVEGGIRPVIAVGPPVAASNVNLPTATTWGTVISNLQQGANNITITATDSAGNITTRQAVITLGVTPPSGTFADVPPSHFAFSHVEAVFAARITGGCSTDPLLFCPDDPVTRGQMAVFLETSLGHSARACPGQFADVPASDPFCGFIERLAEDGVTGGCGNGNFCPNDPVTRGQMAVFIEGALNHPANACSEQFADVTAANPFCGFIERFAADGISSGCGNGNFCPDKPVTRAEMAVFLVAAPDPLLP